MYGGEPGVEDLREFDEPLVIWLLRIEGLICAWCAAEIEVFAMANPDAAIALARPVGFRVVDRRQGRFFSLPFVLVEMKDTASVLSRGDRRVPEIVALLASTCSDEGNSGGFIEVGDSTIPFAGTAPLLASMASRMVSGAGIVEIRGRLPDLFDARDLLDPFRRTS